MKNERTNRIDSSKPELTLRDALAPLFRHRRAAIITFLGVFVLATIVAWAWAARYYQANMQVVVEPGPFGSRDYFGAGGQREQQ